MNSTKILLIVINILFRVVQSTNVFFVHTSMEKSPGIMESCAIESASRQNPDRRIVVYSNGFHDSNVKRLGSNIEVRRFSYNEEFSKASRELSEWYASGKYWEGYCVNNLSNALRLALLSSQGGTYFDMDIISIRNVERSGRNSIGKEFEEHYCNAGLLNWSRRHPLLERAMEDFVIVRDKVWRVQLVRYSQISPGLLSRT